MPYALDENGKDLYRQICENCLMPIRGKVD